MSGLKNLVMGFWAPRKFSHLTPFIASLRHTGFAGDVCIVVQDVSSDIVDELRAHGIIVERAAASAQPRMTAMASRYFSFLDVLARRGAEYAWVLLVDPMAVLFQSDPFAEPLPAEIVYAAEARRVGENQPLRDAMVQAYGEAATHNIRDWLVADSSATMGTASGVLRYLVAMTGQLAGRATPVTGAVDQAVHTYVAHMHPLRDAWLDTEGRLAVALQTVDDAAIECGGQGVLVHGRPAPILSRWDASAKVLRHVVTAAAFQSDASLLGAWPRSTGASLPSPRGERRDAVLAFYQRQRDAGWFLLFLSSLRCVSDALDIHCVGEFDETELALLARFGATAHRVPATEQAIAENIAHFYLSRALDSLNALESERPDQVLVLDSSCAIFPRDPFLTKTIGLSAFAEGPTRIGESDYNRDRLAFFTSPDANVLQLPIVSSAAFRGSVPVLREFYRRLLAELVEQTHALRIPKVVQGAVNKLCRMRDLGFPVIVHPNGAEAYFDFWPSGLAVDTRHGVRIAGSAPSMVLGSHPETTLMTKLRIDLSLPHV